MKSETFPTDNFDWVVNKVIHNKVWKWNKPAFLIRYRIYPRSLFQVCLYLSDTLFPKRNIETKVKVVGQTTCKWLFEYIPYLMRKEGFVSITEFVTHIFFDHPVKIVDRTFHTCTLSIFNCNAWPCLPCYQVVELDTGSCIGSCILTLRFCKSGLP